MLIARRERGERRRHRCRRRLSHRWPRAVPRCDRVGSPVTAGVSGCVAVQEDPQRHDGSDEKAYFKFTDTAIDLR